MRNPERIKKILTYLELYWSTYPDLRLGQIIINLTNTNDPFYVEDNIIEESLINELDKLEERDSREEVFKITDEK